jgi:hypothetical protein
LTRADSEAVDEVGERNEREQILEVTVSVQREYLNRRERNEDGEKFDPGVSFELSVRRLTQVGGRRVDIAGEEGI